MTDSLRFWLSVRGNTGTDAKFIDQAHQSATALLESLVRCGVRNADVPRSRGSEVFAGHEQDVLTVEQSMGKFETGQAELLNWNPKIKCSGRPIAFEPHVLELGVHPEPPRVVFLEHGP